MRTDWRPGRLCGALAIGAAAIALCFAAARPAAAGDEPPAAPGPSEPTPPPPDGDQGAQQPDEAPPPASDAEAAEGDKPQPSEAKPAPSPDPVPKPVQSPADRPSEKKGKRASKKKDKGQRAKKKRRKSKKRFRGCPKDMVAVRGKFCIDRYEAYVVEMLSRGRVRRHSPFEPVAGKKVKAQNRRGRMPQAYISRHEAKQACRNANKRLCTDAEWVEACKGRRPTLYPYGKKWQPGRCNDQGVSSFNKLFSGDGKEAPQSAYTWQNLNDSRLNRPKGTCAPAGRFRKCRNSFKIYDMLGNLHEWTAAPGGTFRGGYYLDVHENGHGCEYKTTAHGPRYHDYSTGFRCCK